MMRLESSWSLGLVEAMIDGHWGRDPISQPLPCNVARYFGSDGRGRLGGGPGQGGYFEPAGMVVIILYALGGMVVEWM